MLYDIIKYFGSFGPLILFLVSLFLLWSKENLFYYYVVGIIMNSILNLVLKGIVQHPRPSEDPQLFHLALKHNKHFLFKDYIPHNIFGMPSGHAQSTFFSTIFIYFSLRKMSVVYFYLLVAFITMSQSVIYNYHTILQVVVGAIVGSAFGYCDYYLAQQKIMGKIREKPDDFAPR